MDARTPSMPPMPVRGPHLRVALCLGVAGAIATLLIFPYLLATMPKLFARLPVSLWLVIPVQALQAGVLCWLLGWLGLTLGGRYALDAPWLRALIYGYAKPSSSRARWGLALLLGLLAGLAVTSLESWLNFHIDAPATGAAVASIPSQLWRGALACFYGGIVEELVCRLFLVSALVWLLARCNRQRAQPWVFVTAIVLAALVFGAGHLPADSAAGIALTPLVVARIVMLNAVVGTVFGGVYWRWGLEHAMLAHFGTDIILHVLQPLAASL